MLYIIQGTDTENSLDLRKENREAHIERLNALKRQGRLVLAGPCPAIDCDEPGSAGFTGSVIIAEFGSQHEATEWANKDPYATNGVYKQVMVKPFIRVLP